MKRVISAIIVLAMLLATAGCGSAPTLAGNTPAASSTANQPVSSGSAAAPAAEKQELVFWTMWDGGDVTVANKIFDEYNAANADTVHITFQQQDFSQFATKLKTGMMSGQGPDFAISYVGGFVTGLQADGMLMPISSEAERLGVDIQFDKYTPEAMAATKVDNDYYAVPCDNLIRVMMYNKALLKDTGVLNDDGSLKLEAGYDNFMSMLQTVKEKTSGVNTLALTMRPPQLVLGWLTTYEQLGGHAFIDEANKQCVFDDALALKALELYRDIYVKYVPENLAPPADLDMFKAGQACFYIDGSWNVSAAAEALGDDFAVTTFPQLGEKNALVTTNHAFIIPKKDDMSDAKTAEILKFIKWWGENNWKWSEAGHMPAYMPSTDTAEFNAMPWPKHYASTLDVAVPIYTIPNANLHQISEVTDPIQKAMLGSISCEEAIKQVKSNLNNLIPNL